MYYWVCPPFPRPRRNERPSYGGSESSSLVASRQVQKRAYKGEEERKQIIKGENQAVRPAWLIVRTLFITHSFIRHNQEPRPLVCGGMEGGIFF